MQVIAQQGETLDLVLWRVHGSTDQIDQVVTANPHCNASEALSGGELITLPDAPERATTKTKAVKLWD